MNYSAAEQDDQNDLDHGVDGYEYPSDTALQVARSRVNQLEAEPLTAYILTHSLHDFMLAMQHWMGRNYFVGDTSAIVCREDLQSAQLFKRLT